MARWVDMEMDDDDKLDAIMPMPMDRPSYPCGLCLSFDKVSIKKLGLEELPSVGDILDMRCFMEVKCVTDGPAGQCFEAQITMILSPVENENEEPEMKAPEPKTPSPTTGRNRSRRASLYGRGANWDQDLA